MVFSGSSDDWLKGLKNFNNMISNVFLSTNCDPGKGLFSSRPAVTPAVSSGGKGLCPVVTLMDLCSPCEKEEQFFMRCFSFGHIMSANPRPEYRIKSCLGSLWFAYWVFLDRFLSVIGFLLKYFLSAFKEPVRIFAFRKRVEECGKLKPGGQGKAAGPNGPSIVQLRHPSEWSVRVSWFPWTPPLFQVWNQQHHTLKDSSNY